MSYNYLGHNFIIYDLIDGHANNYIYVKYAVWKLFPILTSQMNYILMICNI
jgi:hypothetical protein